MFCFQICGRMYYICRLIRENKSLASNAFASAARVRHCLLTKADSYGWFEMVTVLVALKVYRVQQLPNTLPGPFRGGLFFITQCKVKCSNLGFADSGFKFRSACLEKALFQEGHIRLTASLFRLMWIYSWKSTVSTARTATRNAHHSVGAGCGFCCCLGIASRAKMLKICAWLLHPKWWQGSTCRTR